MRKFWLYVAIAALAAMPGIYLRLSGTHLAAIADALIAGLAILGAGFMLSWGVEAAEEHVSRGLSLAVLALITVLPEFVVDFYYVFEGGQQPEPDYAAASRMSELSASRRRSYGTA